MWPSSSYVTRQIDKIGKQMSASLVKADVTSFEDLRQLDAGRIELVSARYGVACCCLIALLTLVLADPSPQSPLWKSGTYTMGWLSCIGT